MEGTGEESQPHPTTAPCWKSIEWLCNIDEKDNNHLVMWLMINHTHHRVQTKNK